MGLFVSVVLFVLLGSLVGCRATPTPTPTPTPISIPAPTATPTLAEVTPTSLPPVREVAIGFIIPWTAPSYYDSVLSHVYEAVDLAVAEWNIEEAPTDLIVRVEALRPDELLEERLRKQAILALVDPLAMTSPLETPSIKDVVTIRGPRGPSKPPPPPCPPCENTFLAMARNEDQARLAAKLASMKFPETAVAVIFDDNDLGRNLRNAFEECFEDLQGEISVTLPLVPGSDEFGDALARIVDQGASAVYYASPNPRIDAFVRQAADVAPELTVISPQAVLEPTTLTMFNAPESELVFPDMKRVPEPLADQIEVNISPAAFYQATKILLTAIGRSPSPEPEYLLAELKETERIYSGWGGWFEQGRFFTRPVQQVLYYQPAPSIIQPSPTLIMIISQ